MSRLSSAIVAVLSAERVHTNKIFALRSAVELDVADDDIVSVPDLEATVGDSGGAANTKDGGVGDNLDDTAAGESALDLDDTALLSSGSQTSAVRDSGACTRATTGGASGETDKLIDGGSPLLHRSSRDGTGSRKNSSKLEETHVVGCVVRNVVGMGVSKRTERMNRDQLLMFAGWIVVSGEASPLIAG
jgi:hypothetical protein